MTTGSYGFKDIFLADCKLCAVTITVDVYAAVLWNLTVVTIGQQQMMLTRALILLYKSLYRVRQKYLTILQTVMSGTVGVGNLSLSALLARLKAFQLSLSGGLHSIGL